MKESAVRRCKSLLARLRRRRRDFSFRKAGDSLLRPHLADYQIFLTSRQTCFEGPFGEVIRATGPMAKANPFRFSTKYQDDETALLYYGDSYCDAGTKNWLSRDPIGGWVANHL